MKARSEEMGVFMILICIDLKGYTESIIITPYCHCLEVISCLSKTASTKLIIVFELPHIILSGISFGKLFLNTQSSTNNETSACRSPCKSSVLIVYSTTIFSYE